MSRFRLAVALTASLSAGIGFAGAARAATETFAATLNGANQVPPVQAPGTGALKATLDTSTKTLTWDVTYEGLTGPATAAHFHGPAPATGNAGVVVPWQVPLASPFHGTATLTDAQVAQLEAGQWYANVHTAKNGNGEIRGQVTRQ